MKKKVFLMLCLVLAVGLVVLTSCGNKEEETNLSSDNNQSIETNLSDENEVSLKKEVTDIAKSSASNSSTSLKSFIITPY